MINLLKWAWFAREQHVTCTRCTLGCPAEGGFSDAALYAEGRPSFVCANCAKGKPPVFPVAPKVLAQAAPRIDPDDVIF
jgi:hypothetical protein